MKQPIEDKLICSQFLFKFAYLGLPQT